MKVNWITALIIASTLAILTLIAFQVRWMQHSQTLLEEQFNQRVKMALCNTVERLAGEESCSQVLQASCSSDDAKSCCQELETLVESEIFDATLGSTLHFYQIDLPYQANIRSKNELSNSGDLPPFSCTLNPLLTSDSHYVQLDFERKQEFILGQMGEMLGSSIFILLFICTIFAMATYHLLRQKKMSDLNREFFNHMAHEFRTPLTNIRLASKMLHKKDQSLQHSPYLSIINQEGDHLMQQVEQVLHMARLEKGDFQLQRKSTDMRHFLQETIQRMQLQQIERSASINLELSDDPILYAIDQLHLGNAVRNILDNALKYCRNEPQIDICLSQDENALKLTVADNGTGLPPEEQQKIFEKFYQNPSGSNRKGFGLGLAYVKRVIELHGGQIMIKSQQMVGTKFEILLPAQSSEA